MLHFDHAATSHPKPAPVLAAMRRWFDELGVTADRGSSGKCREVGDEVRATRQLLGALVGMAADRVAFVSGATEGLNLALRALLRRGDRVLTTAFEHSSVVRPLLALAAERELTVDVLPPDAAGGIAPDRVEAALAATTTRLFAFTHASNVTGTCFDARAFCARARKHGTMTLLDACQTAGLIDVAVGADVVVASGHKALHGPPGVGFVAARAGLDLLPQKQGGTGGSIALATHPTSWPQAFEAGTPNTPAIFGLGAALRWLQQEGPARLHTRSLALLDQLITGLAPIDGVRLLHAPGERMAILSCCHRDYDPAEIGAILDGNGIHVRTGFHCAPWLHSYLGTSTAGTVRLSPGPFCEPADIERVLQIFRDL